MGLDIRVVTDLGPKLLGAEYYLSGLYDKHHLSRDFLAFLERRYEEIAGVKMAPLYEMMDYFSEDDPKLKGNIDIIHALIDKLSAIPHLNDIAQDLQNFRSFLVYAKEQGATSVYFWIE